MVEGTIELHAVSPQWKNYRGWVGYDVI